jgi:hypothetical protein
MRFSLLFVPLLLVACTAATPQDVALKYARAVARKDVEAARPLVTEADRAEPAYLDSHWTAIDAVTVKSTEITGDTAQVTLVGDRAVSGHPLPRESVYWLKKEQGSWRMWVDAAGHESIAKRVTALSDKYLEGEALAGC